MLLRKSNQIMKAFISVYQGISPSLLATISLSQNIKGKNHQDLINSLKKSNIIQSQDLLNVLKKLDRKIFALQNIENPYQNKPYRISKNQTMTDIFTHSIILSNVQEQLKLLSTKQNQKNIYKHKGLKILDIGTGHGYIAFALYHFIKNHQNLNVQKIIGIDCFQQCINKCHQIKRKIQIQSQQMLDKQNILQFNKMDINQILNLNIKFDIIIGGFFIQPNLSQKLQNILTQDGIGIWPGISQTGQGLYKFKKNKSKQYILQTLFSQQIVRSTVQEYFINQTQQQNSNIIDQVSISKQQRQINQKLKIEIIKQQKQNKKKSLQNKLKTLIFKYQNNKIQYPKALTLKQMKQIPEINQILENLKQYK